MGYPGCCCFPPLRRPICSLVAWLFPTSWPIKLMFPIYKLDCYFYCLCRYRSHQEPPSVTSWLVKYGFISLSVCLFCTKHQYNVVWRFRCISSPKCCLLWFSWLTKRLINCSMPESMVFIIGHSSQELWPWIPNNEEGLQVWVVCKPWHFAIKGRMRQIQ